MSRASPPLQFPAEARRRSELFCREAGEFAQSIRCGGTDLEVRVVERFNQHRDTKVGLVQVSDRDALATWVDEVLAANPAEVARYRSGETKLIGFFVGQVMKRSRGKADPKGVQPVLLGRLEGKKD